MLTAAGQQDRTGTSCSEAGGVNAALVLFKDAFHMVDALCW